MDLEAALRHMGRTATRRDLIALGSTDRELARAVESGRLHRVRKGVYAAPLLADGRAQAMRLRGSLTCVSLLRSHGVWVPPDDKRLHVRLPKSARPPSSAQVVAHWARHRRPESIAGALGRMLACAGTEWTVAAADSALHLGLLSEAELMTLPRVVRARADGRCESGGESLVRQRLAARRIRCAPQVQIADVGRVDLLVGDRLVLEVDGFEFHGTRDAFERDRERDRRLVALGYVVIRVTMNQVLHDWARVERAILAIVRSRRHRWPR